MSSGRVARAAARVTHVSRGHGSTSAPSYRRCEGGSRKEGGCRKLQEGCRKVLSRRKARGEASGRGAEAGVAAGSGARRGWSRSGRRAARRSAREARCPGCPARTVSARQRGWTACVGRGWLARLGGLALPQQLCMEPLLDSSHRAERKAGRVEREALWQARQRCCVDLGVLSVLLCLPARLPSVSQCQRECWWLWVGWVRECNSPGRCNGARASRGRPLISGCGRTRRTAGWSPPCWACLCRSWTRSTKRQCSPPRFQCSPPRFARWLTLPTYAAVAQCLHVTVARSGTKPITKQGGGDTGCSGLTSLARIPQKNSNDALTKEF